MRSFLLSFSGKYQVILIVGTTILLAFTIALFTSLFFDIHQLANNTDLIATVYEVMGTIYAILLTFSLWGVWQNFTAASASVQNEAYALLDLVHILSMSFIAGKEHIRHVALLYAKLVVEQEWPTLKTLNNKMINLHACSQTSCMQLIAAVHDIMPATPRDEIIFAHALTLLRNWLDARRSRILIARGNSAKALWPLLFVGAIVLFAFHGLFAAKTIGIWITLLLGASFVIGVTFFLIFTLDCPFEGSLCIDSEPFEFAINAMEKENNL